MRVPFHRWCLAVVAVWLCLAAAVAAAKDPPSADAAASAASAAASAGAGAASAVPPAEAGASKPKVPDGGKTTTTTPGTGSSSNPEGYAAAGKVLFSAFALALFLESALAALFNWRPFVQFCVRGTRTVVSLLFALVLVNASPELDLFSKLVSTISPGPQDLGGLGSFLTAMLLAGGSAGINNLMVALGLRAVRTPESLTPPPPKTKAWIAVRVTEPHRNRVTPLLVRLSVDTGPAAVIGVITGRSDKPQLWRYFFADFGRFPTSGGHAVDGGKTYKIEVTDAAGTVLGQSWGPMLIAAGAIVDIEVVI